MGIEIRKGVVVEVAFEAFVRGKVRPSYGYIFKDYIENWAPLIMDWKEAERAIHPNRDPEAIREEARNIGEIRNHIGCYWMVLE